MSRSEFSFPVGYHEFHKDQLFNYQLNRWYSLGYVPLEDMEEAGRRISDFADWKREMLRLAEAAVSQGRIMNAAFCYRAAEFYTLFGDPDRDVFYDRFIELFYEAFAGEAFERLDVQYGGASLPALRLASAGGAKSGTIVMHGGFDSFIEEFYSWMRYFTDLGFEVIAFEGPGQGAARRKHGLALDHEWEKPARAILDHFGLEDVTWIGISMGGWFCLRAAAFEPRISRVIASGIAFDYSQFPNVAAQVLMRFFFKYLRSFTNRLTLNKMKTDGMHAWSIGNLMYITDTRTPMEAADRAFQMNAKNLHSELVGQDVLILTGRDDHFVPFKMHAKQIRALTNARSVTSRIFTAEEHAQNHCQIGNIGLALDVMAEWISDISRSGCAGT